MFEYSCINCLNLTNIICSKLVTTANYRQENDMGIDLPEICNDLFHEKTFIARVIPRAIDVVVITLAMIFFLFHMWCL